MKVMLHGATNLSNFGDYIFAEMFFKKLEYSGIDVEFYVHPKYGVGKFFRENLRYTPSTENSIRLMNECDSLVYISGGYFVEPRKKGFINEIKHIKRYMSPADYFMKQGKPIYILGIGAGPFENAPFSKRAKKVINYASIVTVRNEESLGFCREFGITRDITVTADTALMVKKYINAYKANVIDDEVSQDNKVLMLHIDSNAEVKDIMFKRFKPAIEEFLAAHDDYRLYMVSDGLKSDAFYKEYGDVFSSCNPVVIRYNNPWVLCRQLEKADIVLTTKLHVGIVSSALGRSVISFPFVPNKTKRFYKQIGEAERCTTLSDVTTKSIIDMIERFKEKPIRVPDEIIDRANINLEMLPGIK